MSINIAIFASGSGTNAENIIKFFNKKVSVNIALVLSNKKDAYVFERTKKYNITSHVFTKQDLIDTDNVLSILQQYKIDFIVLAGFLLPIPKGILDKYHNLIINIHPALLPKYGGKGMYGDYIHKAVVDAGEKESGITIHYIDEKYDEGNIIFQATCMISPDDSPEDVASKVHELEYKYYPRVIEDVLLREKLMN